MGKVSKKKKKTTKTGRGGRVENKVPKKKKKTEIKEKKKLGSGRGENKTSCHPTEMTTCRTGDPSFQCGMGPTGLFHDT